ncbi:MAG TPA: Rieske 2Fe-2S domain-containing protein [Candidatus Elarobacter sp.]|jgi:nitrite reductase/ring-hydroxylating ferredoxin subunit|nr:Rieske 2Fe-2S domain-containing protein [Candidatus Elarobacter sp.]
MSSPNTPCAASCPIDRARFLRRTALAALAGIAGPALLSDRAFAQSVTAVSPSQSHGKVLTYALPAREGASIDAANGVVLARVKNDVYALSIICPHRAVTTLEWLPDAKEFHCPKHDAHFQPDGELIDGRPDRAMDRYAVRRTGKTIAVDTATVFQQDSDQAAWSRALVSAA